jgi:HSP20 family molecular chaperone IbpA
MTIPLDYFGQTAFTSDFSPPFVDHLHERPVSHQSLLQYLLRHRPQPQSTITQPDLDIRETEHEYIIDVELAGVSDKNAINVEWTSSRSLVVSGNIGRPSIPDDKPTDSAPETSAKMSIGARGAAGEWTPAPDTQSPTVVLVVAERKVGPFRRHFNFPVDVDTHKLKAMLKSGLLTIKVPKKGLAVEGRGRVNIEEA